jgi:hypothetical protein
MLPVHSNAPRLIEGANSALLFGSSQLNATVMERNGGL